MDEKESMSMVIRAIETDSIDRVEDIVGRLIDLFNSDESREFLENKMQQARDGLLNLEKAMESSLYEGMKAMRQLVTDQHIHQWSEDSVVSRFQFNSQSLHYILTRASDVLNNDSLSDKEKVQEIWDGIIGSLSQDEDKEKARKSLEEFLCEWQRACKLDFLKKQRLEQQIKTDFEQGLKQKNLDIEELFHQLREYFKGLRSKLEDTQEAVKSGEQKGMLIGVMFGGYGASILVGAIAAGIAAAPVSVPGTIAVSGMVAAGGATGATGAYVGRNVARQEIRNLGGEKN